MAGLEARDSLFAHLETKKLIARTYFAWHFLSAQQATEEGGLGNVYRAPGTENPADGLSRVRSGMAPRPRLLESGHFIPGSLRPLNVAAWKERAGHGKREN